MGFFTDKVVIITGSSNGIGRATARMFAEAGAKITITGRNKASLEETKNQCLAAGAKEEDILEILADVGDDETPKRIVDETVAKFGKLDVLINNAGMSLNDPEDRLFMETPVQMLDEMVKVNLRAIVLFNQNAVPHLMKTKGAIVNVSSIEGYPFAAQKDIYYAVTKAGLDQLTVQHASELANKGVRVNSVNPGLIDTDIWAKQGMSPEEKKAAFEKWCDPTFIPIGRHGDPGEVGKLILFLADRSRSEYIIGQRIIIDGGSSLCNTCLAPFFGNF